jgi:hypothetical protein
MVKITNNVLAAKIDSIKEDIIEIKAHVKETNGKVANAHIQIAELNTKQSNCPARVNYAYDKSNTATWIRWIPSLIGTLIGLFGFFYGFMR